MELEDSGVSKHVYEISVLGRVPDKLLTELGAGIPVLAPTETVIVTGRVDQDQLHSIVSKIADLGLNLRELRRIPTPHRRLHVRTTDDTERGRHG
jgi:hypothetical protein